MFLSFRPFEQCHARVRVCTCKSASWRLGSLSLSSKNQPRAHARLLPSLQPPLTFSSNSPNQQQHRVRLQDQQTAQVVEEVCKSRSGHSNSHPEWPLGMSSLPTPTSTPSLDLRESLSVLSVFNFGYDVLFLSLFLPPLQ